MEKRIYLIRHQKVTIERDLTELYGVETEIFIRAVTRNIDRFPEDFMFQLSKEEYEQLLSAKLPP
ncbi:MAG: ORF6N domain-containing protein [Nitrospiraceae bacterium]|nr:MAG: ORF6N domain-containing protein [Nitrospiraceae bacterium]